MATLMEGLPVTAGQKASTILEAHPGKPILAFHTALMSGSDDASDVAVAIALDPLCGINRRRDITEGAIGSLLSWGDAGTTPLILASSENKLSVAERLLEAGAFPTIAEPQYGYTALHVAPSAEMTDLLLRYNADPRAIDQKGGTPLHSACFNNRSDIIPLLAAKGCDVNARDNTSHTPMHLTVTSEEHIPSLIALLAANANPNIPTQWGSTPFHLAVQYKHLEAATRLASLPGAPLNAADGNGWAPLHHAGGDVLRMLLAKNADIDVKGRDDRRPIHRAVCGLDTDKVSMLLEHGCAVSSDTLLMPIHEAAREGLVEHVAKLLDNGSDINAMRGNGGRSPLHYAAEGTNEDYECSSYPKTISLLAAEGANLESRDAVGCTPLHTAAEHDNDCCLNHLISLGADINAINKEGQTPLHIAAGNMLINTIDDLVQRGGNVHIWDNEAQSALDVFEAAFRALESGDSYSDPPPSKVVDRIRLLLATEWR